MNTMCLEKLKIKEPIYIFEDMLVHKFESEKYLSDCLEAYDIDNYEAYDSNFCKLILFKKDKYNRVGVKIENNKPNKKEFEHKIRNYFLYYNIKQDTDKMNLQDLLLYINSEEKEDENTIGFLKQISSFCFKYTQKVKKLIRVATNED